MSQFWVWPFVKDIRFENTVSQARDLLAAERNFLTIARAALTVTVAAGAVVFQTDLLKHGNWIDWAIAGLLLAVSVPMILFALLNYASQFDAHHREDGEIHNSSWLLAVLLLTGVGAILVAVHEFYAQDYNPAANVIKKTPT